MDYLVDWNCRLIPDGRNDNISSLETVEVMRYLSKRDHFSHFCLISEYTSSFGSIPAYLLFRYKTEHALRTLLPKHIKIKLISSISLIPNLHSLDGLSDFYISKDRLLPITLPLAPYSDWMDVELNQLLYHTQVRPMFLSFDLAVVLYSDDILKRLLRISNAVYQFRYKSLANPKALHWIRYALAQNPSATILLGSLIGSAQEASFHETAYYLKQAADNLSPMEYQLLLHHGRAFWNI